MIPLICGLKYDTNELTHKTKIDSQTEKKKKKTYGYQGGEGRDKSGVWD